ncbi:MAG: ABC transporter ATP-binding protein [Planctomycetota bacterium]
MITLDHVSLEYRLHTQRTNSLRDWLVARVRRRPYRGYRSLWALKDVELRCRRGDRLGILGPNGAGKTSLLRVIAGIFPPTQGIVQCRGRVVPLLELGLGFHYEMTGLENIVLAGVLLGKTRRDARRLAPEVLEFADLLDFAEVPIKYYSSGMAARLAFSIAMQTEPDVLLLDEVFAVGDTHWIQRAEERMKVLLDRAKVVIAVSHNLVLLKQLCAQGLYLDHGQVRAEGTIDEVVRAYEQQEAECRTNIVDNRGRSSVRLLCGADGLKLRVTAEEIPLFGECWVGLFHPEDRRDNYLAYRRVTSDAPTAAFALRSDTAYEARLYRWTPRGESLEASVDILVSNGRAKVALVGIESNEPTARKGDSVAASS